MLIVLTGPGKGKTTSAIGQAIRVAGSGGKVFFAQFIKSPKFVSGEDAILKKLKPRITFHKYGRGFVGIMGDKQPFSVHQKAAATGWRECLTALKDKKYSLVVLDEINNAMHLKLLRVGQVLPRVIQAAKHKDVLLTGRDAPVDLTAAADIYTECKDVHHAYYSGQPAKKGVEY